MNPRDPQCETPGEILAVYLIANGPLGMSAGKLAAQAFQAAVRLHQAYERGEGTSEQRRRYELWQADGTRTIARIAETPAGFERCRLELKGATMIDEGLTEVEPGSATIHATWPLYRGEHRLLSHKRIPLLEGAAITHARARKGPDGANATRTGLTSAASGGA